MPIIPAVFVSLALSLPLVLGVLPKFDTAKGYHQASFLPSTPQKPQAPTAPSWPVRPTGNFLSNPTITPTSKPTATPTLVKIPTTTPTPTPSTGSGSSTSTPTPTESRPTPTLVRVSTPTPTKVPNPTPTASPNLSQRDYMMRQINDYRRSQGLSEVRTDSYTCNFADVRAKEITSGFNHDGFSSRLNNKSLPYPSYRLVVENIAMNSNYQNVVSAWIGSSGHATNLRANTTYGCVGSSGNYYAYEGWQP